jgi:hypothetical protein
MRRSLIPHRVVLALACSGLLASVAAAQSNSMVPPAESSPVVITYPAPEPPPAPKPQTKLAPSLWHRLDLQAACWRDRLIEVERTARDRMGTLMDSDLMICATTTVGAAGYFLRGFAPR